MNDDPPTAPPSTPIPADNLQRNTTIANPNQDKSLTHLGVAGHRWTILLSGDDTDGRYCLIDTFEFNHT
jgi:hypothetical protein